MFKKLQLLMEKGDLKKAHKVLRDIRKLQELSPEDLLSYFQFSRRIGDFNYGATQLEKLGILFPELEIEMAFFLGELGAVQQAIRILRYYQGPLPRSLEVQRYMQLGNFYSLAHQYPEALDAYSKMEVFAQNYNPVLELVAQLNILGHKIYQRLDLKEQIRILQDFKNQKLNSYPLMHQGACYFLSLANKMIGENKLALDYLQEAFAFGAKHRFRESLLLDLMKLEYEPKSLSTTELSKFKKKIYSQVHIVYLDQFHKILGLKSELDRDFKSASRYYQKVIFGNRPNGHYHEALLRWKELNTSSEMNSTPSPNSTESNHNLIPGWLVEKNQIMPLTTNQIIYNQLEKKRWPLLAKGENVLSLDDESLLLKNLMLHLIKNIGFPIRDAEAWEHIWQSQFSFISSATVIRSTLSRLRKSKLSLYTDVIQESRRVSLKFKPGVKFFGP